MYSLQDHIAYNVWGNTKLADVIRTINDEKYHRKMYSSFSSIALTVQHIWGAQHIWFRRFHGESLPASPYSTAIVTKDEALDGLISSAVEIVDFVKAKTPEFFSTYYHYKSMKGDLFHEPYENSLYHIVNHGTYHRGQIVTMLHEGGIDKLPSTDLIAYLRTLPK